MPYAEIAAYYQNVASKILPFLRGRKVGVRHHYDEPVFRRHPTGRLLALRGNSLAARRAWPEPRWIYIPNARVLREIVREHGYEFFPHIEGRRETWFALDIDVRAVPLSLGKTVVQTVLDILDERQVKYLLTFSGSNGFHVRWAYAAARGRKPSWVLQRRIVRALRNEVERRLQQSPQRRQFYRHIPAGDPITELSAADQAAQTSVLFDELILKPQATIRSPFSVHMERRLVAVPIARENLAHFVPTRDATMPAAREYAGVRIPVNPVTMFTKPVWKIPALSS